MSTLQSIPQSYLKRAQSYLHNGHVLSLNIEETPEEEFLVVSLVKGRQTQPYIQTISIDWKAKKFNGECSCPMSYNCKHVVAAYLAFEEQMKDRTSNLETTKAEPWKGWLTDMSQTLEPAEDVTTQQDKFIIFLLEPSRNEGMTLSVIQTYKLKRGGLAKGSIKSLENIIYDYYPTPSLTESDKDIIQLAMLTAPNDWSAPTFTGEAGALALQQMIQTGRTYWKDHQGNPPLHMDDARNLNIFWKENNKGESQLICQLKPVAKILPSEPPLYLDPKRHTVGHIDTPLSAEQLNLLRQAPKVAQDDVVRFSQHLATQLPPSLLSPPCEVAIETIENCPPIPVLLLSQVKEVDGVPLHIMRLRFLYEQEEISILPEQAMKNISRDDQLIQIHRQNEQEHIFADTLRHLGFSPRQSENGKELLFISEGKNLLSVIQPWEQFLEDELPKLQEDGWQVSFDDSFSMNFQPIDGLNIAIEADGQDWFDLHMDVAWNDQKVPLAPLIAQILEAFTPNNLPERISLPMGEGQYIQLQREQIQPVIDTIYQLFSHESDSVRISRFEAGLLEGLEQYNAAPIQWQGGEPLRELGEKLRHFSGIAEVTVPEGLNAELRPYQKQGLNWLQFLSSYKLSGILADDMGLGKTVQALTHLLLEKEQGRMQLPSLIVAPTSLMSNWKREAKAFTPALKVLILQGLDRAKHFESITEYDLVLSTYPLLSRDEEVLTKQPWHMLILDEAQNIKNPTTHAARVVRTLHANHRLCLTGTPMENHLGELWALFDFLMPGFLGNTKLFRERFRKPIEQLGDSERQKMLSRRINPFMLRRTKSEVLQELPQKTEIIRSITLAPKQAALYESIRVSMEKSVRDVIAVQGLARSHIMVLDALLKLRQVCCDPQLLPLEQAKKVKGSAKLEALMELLPEMLAEGRRILIFSQFTKMLGLIETQLKKEKISYSKLTGQTRKRDEAIQKFKLGQANVFLISLKAGGVGLNLTEADTVIHYDPWWNPAVENQATDRAHRIGQEKAVFVYKLVVENSVEEKMLAMQEKKQALADQVYQSGSQGGQRTLTSEDMQKLFAPM